MTNKEKILNLLDEYIGEEDKQAETCYEFTKSSKSSTEESMWWSYLSKYCHGYCILKELKEEIQKILEK